MAAGAVVAVGSEAGSGRLLAASRRPAKGGRRARTGERETEIAAEILSQRERKETFKAFCAANQLPPDISMCIRPRISFHARPSSSVEH